MIKTLKRIAYDLRVKAGYSGAFILLLISYFLTLYGNNQLMKQTAWVNHSNKMIKNLDALISGVKDAETGMRGYMNTADTSFLAPYRTSFPIVNEAYRVLKFEMNQDDTQRNDLVTLGTLIRSRYEKIMFAIDYLPKTKYVIDDSLVQSFHWGKSVMDRIRIVVNSMQEHEQSLLNSRIKKVDAEYKALNIIIITSLVLAIIFAIFGFYTFRREYKARLVADKRGDNYQKELQQRIVELDKANKELVLMKRNEKFAATGRIARAIAHEVRNPLTNIDLAISQIKAEMDEQDENSTMLFDMVNRNSRRINQLVSELLNATRFAELNYISISINKILNDALELAKDRIELNRIKVEKSYDMNICNISVDSEKVKIAFLNLIVNAIEAMEPDKGILKIITREEDDKCVVEITDNGSGMEEEELNKLFEPYFTTKTNGNGLGLTNTQNIILNHKGSVSVTSKTGTGTTFVIKFDFATPA